MPRSKESYEDYKKAQAEISRRRSQAGREIGPTPPILDIERRESTRKSLRLFCETYNPDAFYLDWSPTQLQAIERIEEAVFLGALYAFAMPRGSGKSSICRMAVLWAIGHALCRYVFVIGANADKAQESLGAVKVFMRFLPMFAADFPDLSHAVQALGGIATRAHGQTCDGESTLIEWSSARVVLPTVPPPSNWPKAWPLRADGKVPTAGAVIGVSGLTGDGIRGSLATTTTGEGIRPDLVLLDDPQTDESAHSGPQNRTRERLIAGAVLGMAGPDKSISAVMPCTVIAKGDMVDRVLNRKHHPLWRGERSKMLTSMPANMDRWDPYFEVYARCAQREPPDFTESNAFYESNRAILDEGAVASWEDRKKPGEISAIQSAMNLFFRDRRAFFAEYQNDPLDAEEALGDAIEPDDVAAKANRIARGIVPDWATTITAFVDVQGSGVLYWVVAAWGDGFRGHVVDYGIFPEQPDGTMALSGVKRTVQNIFPGTGPNGALNAGLTSLTDRLATTQWKTESGGELRVSQLFVDSGYKAGSLVYEFCKRSSHANVILPSRGMGVGPDKEPMANWTRYPGDRVGADWKIGHPRNDQTVWLCMIDTNAWKSFVRDRVVTAAGDPGSLSLFGDARDHEEFAAQVTAEVPHPLQHEKTGRRLEVWKSRPFKTDNHMLDCLVGCAVAASVRGVTLLGQEPAGQPTVRRRIRLSDIQKQRRGR